MSFTIERAVPALRFQKSCPVSEALPRFQSLDPFGSLCIRKQEGIGDILPSLGRHVLLDGLVFPSQTWGAAATPCLEPTQITSFAGVLQFNLLNQVPCCR